MWFALEIAILGMKLALVVVSMIRGNSIAFGHRPVDIQSDYHAGMGSLLGSHYPHFFKPKR